MTKSAKGFEHSHGVVRVGVHEAKTQLSSLLRLVDGGQIVEIQRNGVPVAKLVAISSATRRSFGHDRDLFRVPDDFDLPLPDLEMAAFEQ